MKKEFEIEYSSFSNIDDKFHEAHERFQESLTKKRKNSTFSKNKIPQKKPLFSNQENQYKTLENTKKTTSTLSSNLKNSFTKNVANVEKTGYKPLPNVTILPKPTSTILPSQEIPTSTFPTLTSPPTNIVSSNNTSSCTGSIYGNYPHYYGYRHKYDDVDVRLSLLKQEWFHDKNVLDIGCNSGKLALDIAGKFKVKRIVGIDIDTKLIKAAKQQLKLLKTTQQHKNKHSNNSNMQTKERQVTMRKKIDGVKNDGLVASRSFKAHQKQKFSTKNVFFVQSDYAAQAYTSTFPEYDVILAFSVTKWIHLSYGDEGLKRAFQKMYDQLKDGGMLLLEPQEWSSYRKKKVKGRVSCSELKFRPDNFIEYLIDVVGFHSVHPLGTPQHSLKGFQRKIFLFKKPSSMHATT